MVSKYRIARYANYLKVKTRLFTSRGYKIPKLRAKFARTFRPNRLNLISVVKCHGCVTEKLSRIPKQKRGCKWSVGPVQNPDSKRVFYILNTSKEIA